jgi:hypothetical protein
MTVQKARLILGDEAKKFTDDDILEIISILVVFVKGFFNNSMPLIFSFSIKNFAISSRIYLFSVISFIPL